MNELRLADETKEKQDNTKESANNNETDKKSKLDMLKTIWEKSKEEN